MASWMEKMLGFQAAAASFMSASSSVWHFFTFFGAFFFTSESFPLTLETNEINVKKGLTMLWYMHSHILQRPGRFWKLLEIRPYHLYCCLLGDKLSSAIGRYRVKVSPTPLRLRSPWWWHCTMLQLLKSLSHRTAHRLGYGAELSSKLSSTFLEYGGGASNPRYSSV